MPLLRRCDANSGYNVRPATGVPDHRAANSEKEATLTKQANDFRRRIFSREDIFARGYFRGKIFSREDIFAWTVNSRKYLLAKIFQIDFSRNFPPAKIKCYTVFTAVGCSMWLCNLICIHVNPERSFGGTKGEPPSEASQLRKGVRGPPRKI